MTSFVFRETLMGHLLLWGNAYAQIIRNGRGQVVAFYPLLPDRMEVGRTEKGELFTATKKMAETISYARMKSYMCFIDRLYLALLEQGWTLNEIDSMDVIYYLHLLKRKRGDEKVYIDSVL